MSKKLHYKQIKRRKYLMHKIKLFRGNQDSFKAFPYTTSYHEMVYQTAYNRYHDWLKLEYKKKNIPITIKDTVYQIPFNLSNRQLSGIKYELNNAISYKDNKIKEIKAYLANLKTSHKFQGLLDEMVKIYEELTPLQAKQAEEEQGFLLSVDVLADFDDSAKTPGSDDYNRIKIIKINQILAEAKTKMFPDIKEMIKEINNTMYKY